MRGKGDSITLGVSGVVSSLCPLSSRGVGFLRNLVGWPTPSITPSVYFTSSLALSCFARQAAGQGSCSQVGCGSGVTVPVEEIIVMQSGLGLCKVGFLRDRGYPEVCNGFINPGRGDIVPGAGCRILLLIFFSPCLTTRGVEFLSLYGSTIAP